MFATVFTAYVLWWNTETTLLEPTSPNWFCPWNVMDCSHDLANGCMDRGVASAGRMGSCIWAASPHHTYWHSLAAAVKKNLSNLVTASKSSSSTTTATTKSPLPHRKSSKQHANQRREQERENKALSYWSTGTPTRGQSSCTAMQIMYHWHVGNLPHGLIWIVQYIPEPAFSSLLILSGIDMIRTWFVGSFSKTEALRVRLKTVFEQSFWRTSKGSPLLRRLSIPIVHPPGNHKLHNRISNSWFRGRIEPLNGSWPNDRIQGES
jgi:hypothetical protein